MKRVKLLCAIAAICAIAAASSAFAKSPTAVVAIQNGKAMLKKAIETGKYAQGYGQPDEKADLEQQIDEAQKEIDNLNKQIKMRNSIPWWEPTGYKEPGPDGSNGGGKVDPRTPGPCDPVIWVGPCDPVNPCDQVAPISGCGGDCFTDGCYDWCDCYCQPCVKRSCFTILHGVLRGLFGK